MIMDFKKVNVIIENQMLVDLGSGTPIVSSYNSDRITPYVGAKGEVAKAISNDDTGTLTVTLQQTSISNKLLHSLDKKEFTMTLVDKNDEGKVKATVTGCTIQTYADVERGSEITEREWVIFVPNLQYQLN